MKRIIACFLVIGFSLLSTASAQSLDEIIAQKPDWPKKVKIVKPIVADLFNKEGKRMGRQRLPLGGTLEIHGVFKEGVAIKLGKMVVFVPPEATDILDGIKDVQRKKDMILPKPRPDRLSSVY